MSSSPDDRRRLFICGCHRTGTTLLQRTLDRHPEVDVLPETKLFAGLWRPWPSVRRLPGRDLITRLHVEMPIINRAWGLPEQATRLRRLGESVEGAPVRFESVAHVMGHVLDACAAPGASVVGEKTPLHVFHLEGIFERFPDAQVIVTERDLRAGYASQLERTGCELSFRPFSAANYVVSWVSAMRLADRALRRYGPERVRIVRFESLVTEPESILRDLCEWLSLPFDPSLLDARVENSSFEAQEAGFSGAAAERWRSALSPEAVAFLESVAGTTLTDRGYAVERDGTRPSHRLAGVATRVASVVASRCPRTTCYLARDPRYRAARRAFRRTPRGLPAGETAPQIIVLGNHKSGTTAIASLLGEMCALPTGIDFPRRHRRAGYALARGAVSMRRLQGRHPELFHATILKIPALTFVASQLPEVFPRARYVVIIRDPRDNIRSILNRRGVEGDASTPSLRARLRAAWLKTPSMDGAAWGAPGADHVEALAHRWNAAVASIDALEAPIELIRYEAFLEDKAGTLAGLAERLGLEVRASIAERVDHQFQPAGDRSADWASFFGPERLEAINRICADGIRRFGYPDASPHEAPP